MTASFNDSICSRMPTACWLLVLSAACGNQATPAVTLAAAGTGAVATVPSVAGAASNTVPGGTGSPTLSGNNTAGALSSASASANAGAAAPAAGGAAAPITAGAGAQPAANGGSAGNAGSVATDVACQGFKLDGLMYSPGGSVLPNKCMPFHATTNNPYAVRCVDAWPWYKTQFPGDNFCILPPPPDKGVQYGVHPQGARWYEQVSKGDMSGYEKLGNAWLMDDGEEEQANFETSAPNTAEAHFYRSYARMRPGSHHMIVNSDPNKPGNDTWTPVSEGGLAEGAAGLLGAIGLPGAQRPDENRPPSLEKAQEDSGLYRVLPKNAKITFNMHHFNASGRQIMKEAWTNLWWEEDARTLVHGLKGLEVGQVITMQIPPGDTQDLHYSWSITEPVRLVEAFGHRHAWTTNFSAWIENADGKLDIVYQSFEWLDEPTYRYDSVTQNPLPAPEARTDGASSGVRTLMPGQKLHFNCHIEFTPERAASEKAPTPASIGPLHFANEAFTGEMCILFGSTAAVEMPAPVVDSSRLPDFATLD